MRHRTPSLILRLFWVLVAATLIAGCQRFGLLYDRLDWYAGWRLSRYVDLRPEQEQQFDREFARLWQWHRRQMLPAYAEDLRRLRKELQETQPAADQVLRWLHHAESQLQVLAGHALPAICGLARTLDDRQVGQIMARIDREQAEFVDRYVTPPERRRRRDVEKRQRRHLEHWLGELTQAQEAMLRAWARDRDELAPAWLTYREQWQAQLAQALALRQDEEGCTRLKPLLLQPRGQQTPELQARSAVAQRHWSRMVTAILNAMTDTQRQHLDRRIAETIAQLEQLSRRAER